MHMAASYTALALQEYEAPLDGAIALRLSIFGETFFGCEREMPWLNEYRAELLRQSAGNVQKRYSYLGTL